MPSNLVWLGWGRPPGLLVYGIDERGEMAPVEYRPGEEPPDSEWREATVTVWEWPDLVALGQRYGWVPEGTLPDEGPDDGPRGPYEPWADYARVTGPDAAAWADALDRALADPAAWPAPDPAAPGRGLRPDRARAFAAFLRRGPFRFAYDE